jgi:hypothetical protein
VNSHEALRMVIVYAHEYVSNSSLTCFVCLSPSPQVTDEQASRACVGLKFEILSRNKSYHVLIILVEALAKQSALLSFVSDNSS